MQQLIGKGGQLNVVDILKYLISGLIERKILDVMNPKIHLRISDDGRNVGQKIKQGYIRPAIFDMIPLQHWVPDELHIMLCITDILWRLVLDELRSRNT
ncbi:hypothetical protein RhiirC2_775545 [Rhizophagus irregularis]|uniref:Uncharacterized protein n=1 Tax=Rhizophagus irregularis TaxID=588596 RepID=A0A2N1NIS6_9GLOM|nr:hypothetical protein RhiirC2_775545 [Rhizophagus irregularis]